MKISLTKMLHRLGLVQTTSNGRRVIEQGGVQLNGVLVSDPRQVVEFQVGDTVQVGRALKATVSEKDLIEDSKR